MSLIGINTSRHFCSQTQSNTAKTFCEGNGMILYEPASDIELAIIMAELHIDITDYKYWVGGKSNIIFTFLCE